MKHKAIHPTTTFLYLALGIIGVSALSHALQFSTTYSYTTSGGETLSYSDYNWRYTIILTINSFIYIITTLVLYIKILRNKFLQPHVWNRVGAWCLLIAFCIPGIRSMLLSIWGNTTEHVLTAMSYFSSILTVVSFYLLVFKNTLPTISKIALISWEPAIFLIGQFFSPSQDSSMIEGWEQRSLLYALYLTLDIVIFALIALGLKKAKAIIGYQHDETSI